MGSQGSIDWINLLAAIATLKLHVALEVAEANGPIPGTQIHPSLARHMDFHVYAVAMDIHADNADVMLMRQADFELHLVSHLALDHSEASLADFLMFRGYPDINCFAAPRIHAKFGVGGYD